MVCIGKSGISEQDEGQVHLAESLNRGLSFSNLAFIPVAQKVEHALVTIWVMGSLLRDARAFKMYALNAIQFTLDEASAKCVNVNFY